jgi:hypothetical protein
MKTAIAMLAATAAVLSLVRPLEPYAWGHRLSGGCQWLPQPSQQFVGRDAPDASAITAELACWRRHGAKAFSGDVREILSRWPTRAELAAWNGEQP